MGSDAHVLLGSGDDHLLAWAEREVVRLERCWSRFLPGSELCRLNRLAGQWVRVSPTMLLALRRASQLVELTGGAFDPTILPALQRCGYDRTFREVPSQGDAPEGAACPSPGFRLEIDQEAQAVRIEAGTAIDLGGIGKGLAADLVAEGLVDRGARSVLVALGGDIRLCGDRPDGGWRIPIEDPRDPSVLWEEVLDGGSIVTSTTLIRRWCRGGRRFHHLIDPRTGLPADRGVAAVVAAAPSGWLAEGLAKAVVVAGVEEGRRILRRTRARAWIFTHGGTVVEVPCSPR